MAKRKSEKQEAAPAELPSPPTFGGETWAPAFPEVYRAVRALVRERFAALLSADGSDEVLEKMAQVIGDVVAGIDHGMREGEVGQSGPISCFSLVWAFEGLTLGWEGAATNVTVSDKDEPGDVATRAMHRIMAAQIHDAQVRLALASRACSQIVQADAMAQLDARSSNGEVGNA